MPEGPEIRLAADQVANAIAGEVASSVFFHHEHLKHFESLLTGERVLSVAPRGKALLTRFANGLAIYSHNQLYGRWYVRSGGRLPPTRRQLRLAIHTPRRSALLYSASEIDVLDEVELDAHPFLSRLGPDVLDPDTAPRVIDARLADPRFRRRQLAALLLDQGFLAGLGNYLRSEILFVAALHPSLRPQDLSDAERKRLARAIRSVARRAYRTRGITNDPERVRRLKARGVPRREHRFHVFARHGRPCQTCGARVRKLELAGRRLYLCPRCQPARS
ncbi:MAG: endonuclease VIII [Myxococcota bacterium]|nr:endonuclease VIII [Myxococcota bacterium]